MLKPSSPKRAQRIAGDTNLSELKTGERGVLERLELPEDVGRRLMELGFVPGNLIEPGGSAPGGEPRVYRVDGSEIAIRRETAKHIFVIVNAS